MPPRRRVPLQQGRAALVAWQAGDADRQTVATAVRYTVEELAERAPGHSVEVRVPPYAAAQCIEGPTHRRGTPPNVVETDATTWLELAVGRLTWHEAWTAGRLSVSGTRADLSTHLPLASGQGADQGHRESGKQERA